MKIIIARYKEDISWIKDIKKELKDIVVYNKGTSLNIDNEIMMENVGKEGHTFYKYIYDHYDELDDYIMFLQGNPFDHLPNAINVINQFIENEYKLKSSFCALSSRILRCNLIDCQYHKNLPLYQTYQYLFGESRNDLHYLFGAGGQFIVHKIEILRHPKEFYLKIVNLLSYSVNPIEGFVIERFHAIIFNHYILNRPYDQMKLEYKYYDKNYKMLYKL